MKEPQGRRLIKMLKYRAMTTLEMQMTGISVAPWKRISECLQEGETLMIVGKRGRSNIYRVVTQPKTVWMKK